MDAEIVPQSDRVIVRLTGDAVISHAAALRDAFLTALELGNPLLVDASGVGRIDAAAAQVLLSAHQTCERLGRGFSVQGIGPDILNAWQGIGGPDGVVGPRVEEGV